MEIGWAANKRPTDRRLHFAAGGVRKQVMFALHCNAATGYRVKCPGCVSAYVQMELVLHAIFDIQVLAYGVLLRQSH